MSSVASSAGEEESWNEVRKDALKSADNKCEFCGLDSEKHQEKYDQDLHVHHIIPRSAGGTNEQSNLMVVCHNCHQKIESSQGEAMKKLREEQTDVRDVAKLEREVARLKSEKEELREKLQNREGTVVTGLKGEYVKLYLVIGYSDYSVEIQTHTTDKDDAVKAFKRTELKNPKLVTRRINLSDWVFDNIYQAVDGEQIGLVTSLYSQTDVESRGFSAKEPMSYEEYMGSSDE